MPNADLELHDHHAIVTLTRAERANALDSATARELAAAFRESEEAGARTVVFRGAGDGAFCAGADLDQLSTLDVPGAERFIRDLHGAMQAIRKHPGIVIAEVAGHALGAGLELVISCDFALVAEGAELGMPEPHIAVPSVVEAAMMPSLIGLAKTRELLYLGDPISAAEAEKIGLINRALPREELGTATEELISRLHRHTAHTLALQKQLIRRWMSLPLEEAIEAGVRAFAMAVASGEPKEAVAAWKSARRSD